MPDQNNNDILSQAEKLYQNPQKGGGGDILSQAEKLYQNNDVDVISAGVSKGTETWNWAGAPFDAVHAAVSAMVPEEVKLAWNEYMPLDALKIGGDSASQRREQMQKEIEVNNPIADLSKEQKATYAFWKSIGANLPAAFATAPFSPATLSAEILASHSAAWGAYIAEMQDPGNQLRSITYEIAGGVLNPTAIALSSLGMSAKGLKAAIKARLSETGRYQAASKAAGKKLDEVGSNVDDVIAKLEEPNVVEGLSSAAKTGDPGLAIIERYFRKSNPDMDRDFANQMLDGIKEFNKTLKTAMRTGDTELIEIAAKARRDQFIAFSNSILSAAEKRADDLMEAALDPDDMLAASSEGQKILQEAQDLARDVGRKLWNEVDNSIVVPNYTGYKDALDNASELVLKRFGGTPHDLIVKYIKDRPDVMRVLRKLDKQMKPPAKPGTIGARKAKKGKKEKKIHLTIGEVKILRTALNEAARKARGVGTDGDRIAAKALQDISSGLRDDIAGLSDEAANAATYSKEFHDRWSRSAAGKALSKNNEGAYVQSPDLLYKNMGRGERGASNLRQMRGAFGRGTAELTDEAAEQAEGLTGLLNQFDEQAMKYIGASNDAALLNEYPGLAQRVQSDLAELAKTKALGKFIPQLQKNADDAAGYAKMLKYEEGTYHRAFADALNSKKPSAEMGRLFRLTRGKTPKETMGFRKAARAGIYEAIAEMSTSANGLVTGDNIRKLIANKKMVAMAKRYKVLNDTDIKNLEKLADQSDFMDMVMKGGSSTDDMLEETSMVAELLARLTGAQMGGGPVATSTGSSLVMAQAGSSAMRKWLNKLPRKSVRNIIAEASKDPQLMAALLKKYKDLPPGELMEIKGKIGAIILHGMRPKPGVTSGILGSALYEEF
jgi:hypothetical protein